VSTRIVLGQLVVNTAGAWVAATFLTMSVTQTALKSWSSEMMSPSHQIMMISLSHQMMTPSHRIFHVTLITIAGRMSHLLNL
jgi:glycerol-3-phosphate dehydrogenase